MYSKGISWIDDCRIPFVDEGDKGSAKPQGKTTVIRNVLFNPTNDMVRSELETTQGQGRFPANILVSDDMLNDGSIGKGSGIEKMTVNNHSQTESKYQYSKIKKQFSIADKGSNSRYYNIDKWFNNLIDG
jgi:hypothetical protein